MDSRPRPIFFSVFFGYASWIFAYQSTLHLFGSDPTRHEAVEGLI